MRTLLLIFVGIFFAVVGSYAQDTQKDDVEVTSIYDGDTITVKFELGNQIRVRLIGIDAPEIATNIHGQASKYGPASRDHLKGLIEAGRVKLEYDVEKYDKYNRILAYVFTAGGIMVNERMLKDGYALLYTVPPNIKYVEKFKTAQENARNTNSGLWRLGGLKVPAKISKPAKKVRKPKAKIRAVTVYITRTGSKYHSAGCRYLRRSCIPISLKDARNQGYSP